MLTKKQEKKIETKNPCLIVGLPGIANIGRITVDFLIENLKAEKISDYYSDSFPALVIIDEDSSVDLPKVSMYYKNINEKDYLFLVGDVQPSDEQNYSFCSEIINEYKPSLIITIGGIASAERPKTPSVHATYSDKSVVESLEKLGVVFDGNEVVSLIIGAAGVMLGAGKMQEIPGFALLVETIGTSNYFGIKESEPVLDVINKYFGFELDLSSLKKEITKYEKEYKKRSKVEDEIQEYILKHGSELDPRYIG